MPEEPRCPSCSPDNVLFSAKRKVHFCENCGNEFAHDKPFAALRLFLSYGPSNRRVES